MWLDKPPNPLRPRHYPPIVYPGVKPTRIKYVELREYLKEKNITMATMGTRVKRAQSIISRICAHKHRPDPTTAVRIVIATKGAVSLDDLYGTPAKYRADSISRRNN